MFLWSLQIPVFFAWGKDNFPWVQWMNSHYHPEKLLPHSALTDRNFRFFVIWQWSLQCFLDISLLLSWTKSYTSWTSDFQILSSKMLTYSLSSSSSQQDCYTVKCKMKSITFCVWKTVKNILSSLILLFYCYLFIVQGLHFPLYSIFLWVIYHLFSLELLQQNRHSYCTIWMTTIGHVMRWLNHTSEISVFLHNYKGNLSWFVHK